MVINIWFKKSISKESFLIFRENPPLRPPEGEKKAKEKTDKGKDEHEKFKKGRAKQADKTAEELATPPEKKQEKKSPVPKTFLEALTKKELPEHLERLRQKAESDEVTLIELQGGHKWLDITEQENIKHPNKKYLKLSQMYLDLREDKKTGEDTLTVKQELDRNYKTKFGIGATTLLPPTFETIEITTNNGQTLGKGIRSINPENGRIGYYQMKADGTPDYGKYLPIFGGYKIKPLTFIDENSDEYKKITAAEKQNFENKAKAAKEYERAVSTTERDVRQYVGRRDYPISTLQSLRAKTPAELAKKVDAVEIERIAKAKSDLNKIDSLLYHFNLNMDSRSEIDGGLYLVGLDGKGAEMLGWNNNCENLQRDWLKKLTDKDYVKKTTEDGKLTLRWSTTMQATLEVKITDGKYTFLDSSGKKIDNLEKWTLKYSARLAEENKTVKLIKAMQNGQKYRGFEFAGGYELNLSHLLKLNNLANNESETVAKLNQIRQKEYPIRARTLIESLFNQGGKTLSLEEAKRFILDNNMSPLISGNTTLDNLYNQSRKSPTTFVNYNWNTHSGSLNHPIGGGVKCCARMVSDILGLQTNQSGKEAVVSHLVSRIMKGNEAKTGNAGIVFGFENFQKGDVVVWQTYKKELGKRTFAHVGIIRDTINIDGQKFIAIQHDASNIQIELIPTTKGTSVDSLAREMSRNRHALAARQNPEDQAKLESIFTYRSSHPNTVRIRRNAGWFGDGSKNGGDIALAVRTTALTDNNDRPMV